MDNWLDLIAEGGSRASEGNNRKMLGVARQDAVPVGSDEEVELRKQDEIFNKYYMYSRTSSILGPDGDSG